jgi:dTDP-4-amino-4,6-dideoxy-D-galactose acyltransferase
MISKLEWDSNFFGYDVAKIVLDNESEINLSITKPFVLTYLFSAEQKSEIENKLVDIKCNYIKEIKKVVIENSIEIDEYKVQINSFDEIKELVFLSGIYSRFRKDPKFTNNEFEKMYSIWFKKSLFNCDSGIGKVYIIKEEKIIVGFVTLDFEDSNNARIGLIATDLNAQGKGYASKLIKRCETECLSRNISFLKVATQGLNEAANRLYEKNNFILDSKTYIYHHWNK